MATAHRPLTPLDSRAHLVFGTRDDSMHDLVLRAEKLLPERDAILWEVDASSLRFRYVSPSAERLLHYPVRNWLEDPSFWRERLVHPEDRTEALAALALAMGNGVDGDATVRLLTASGDALPFRMLVHVLNGERGIATCLRGLMVSLAPSPADAAGGAEAAGTPYARMPNSSLSRVHVA